MCDQTEVVYSPGDVVWVKLGPVWWPGQVQDYEKLPEEITTNFRKKPIAVVKFFQEDAFEYVKNINHIYQYNCRRKEEFIKKGLDLVRSSNTRDVPSNMKMFPNDIVMAEHITGGNPNILNDKVFLPEEKSDYKELFGAKKSSGKKNKLESLKRERDDWKSRSISPTGNKRISLSALPSTIPRPITHPRFITKALEGRSDHEVRVRIQIPPIDDCEEPVPIKNYTCYICGFETIRLNVMVFHNRSHSAGFLAAEKAVKSRLKAKGKERMLSSLSASFDSTPTTVTSRGRVKSLPKKLMDYTDEPPPKVMREKVSPSKTRSESPNKRSSEKSPVKTPKKEKEDFDAKSIKRPLFGKRKSAKEKAEKAAKIKQENEAMKETLLKDWDDFDVSEEEVEMERLKLALESTPSTSNVEGEGKFASIDESDDPKPDDEKPVSKVKNKLLGNKQTLPVTKSNIKPIETKVFEFDDSEDSLPVDINFRLKNQKEKFTDDKFKKPKPPKPLSKVSPKTKVVPLNLPPSSLEQKKEVDKETDEFNEAFNNLLEETTVPLLPEIPKIASSASKQINEQASNLKSVDDIDEFSRNSYCGDDLISSDQFIDQSSYESSEKNYKPECGSSEITNENNSSVNQKNFEAVLASDPSAEMDVKLEAGVIETSVGMHNSDESSQINKNVQISDIFNAIEAPSMSDALQVVTEESNVKVECKDDEFLGYDTSQSLQNRKTDFQLEDSKSHIFNDLNKCKNDCSATEHKLDNITSQATSNVDKPKIQGTKSSDMKQFVDQQGIGKITESVNDESSKILSQHSDLLGEKNSESCESSVDPEAQEVTTVKRETILTFSSDGNYLDTEVVKEETVMLQDEETAVIAEEVVQQIPSSSSDQISVQSQNSASGQVISTDDSNIQFVIPYSSNSESVQYSYQQQPIHAVQTIVQELPKEGQTKNTALSQNLQDMELDINSMPVIIGGEDFIQPEQPKQNFVPIQPKYSESIVISPKSSPKKSESVIMHLGEPSTSKQNVQSIISIPSRGARGGNRGARLQKTTSKTIKLSENALKNLGLPTKSGNQPVLILKATSSGQDKQIKGCVQKNTVPLNMFQHGNKILLLDKSHVTGQSKVKGGTHQLISGGKLAPGTKFYTAKVVSSSTAQTSITPNKVGTSVSSPVLNQKLVNSKGGVLTSIPKTMIINSSTGKVVPSTHTLTTSKGQTVIAHSIINSKGNIILPNSSQSSSIVKTANISLPSSQGLTASKNMILTTGTNKGDTIISGNQKLRVVSSKAPLKGTRLVVQNSPGKITIDPQGKGQQVKFISSLKGQPSGNTFWIQTSQGLVKTIAPSLTTTSVSQQVVKSVDLGKTIVNSTSPVKIRGKPSLSYQPKVIQSKSVQQVLKQPQILQLTQPVQPSQIVQKSQSVQQTTTVQPKVLKTTPVVKRASAPRSRQSPSTPKPPRKTTPRAPKTKVAKTSEQIIISPTSNLPVINQSSLAQGEIPQSSEVVYLTVDESGNYRQVDKSLVTFQGSSSEAPQTIFIPANNQIQDVGSLLLALDNAGNIVNISQPPSSTSFATEKAAPSQDILAKALANTQVLQQETIIPDIDVTLALSNSLDSTVLATSSFSEQAQYPPSLSHSVLETSLTLNQPIMTPLEVPSAVSPNLSQVSSMQSSYISNIVTDKQSHLPPSMPLLTEESLVNQASGESVFLLDNSSIIPATSGSQISFQLTLQDNNVIMTSGGGGSGIPQTYQVVSSGILPPQLVVPDTHASFQKIENESENVISGEGYSIITKVGETDQGTSESAETFILSDDSKTSVCIESNDNRGVISHQESKKEDFNIDTVEQHCEVAEHSETVQYCTQSADLLSTQDNAFKIEGDLGDTLKRSFEEDDTIMSDSDENLKKMKIEER